MFTLGTFKGPFFFHSVLCNDISLYYGDLSRSNNSLLFLCARVSIAAWKQILKQWTCRSLNALKRPKSMWKNDIVLRILYKVIEGRSGLLNWKCQFSYEPWSQATLSSVSTWIGDYSSVFFRALLSHCNWAVLAGAVQNLWFKQLLVNATLEDLKLDWKSR